MPIEWIALKYSKREKTITILMLAFLCLSVKYLVIEIEQMKDLRN